MTSIAFSIKPNQGCYRILAHYRTQPRRVRVQSVRCDFLTFVCSQITNQPLRIRFILSAAKRIQDYNRRSCGHFRSRSVVKQHRPIMSVKIGRARTRQNERAHPSQESQGYAAFGPKSLHTRSLIPSPLPQFLWALHLTRVHAIRPPALRPLLKPTKRIRHYGLRNHRLSMCHPQGLFYHSVFWRKRTSRIRRRSIPQ